MSFSPVPQKNNVPLKKRDSLTELQFLAKYLNNVVVIAREPYGNKKMTGQT